jgi:hypothetical protein
MSDRIAGAARCSTPRLRSSPAACPFDVQHLDELDAKIGTSHLSRAREAGGRGHDLAPSTVARRRSTLLAAPTYGADEFGIATPSLPAVRGVDGERIAYLTAQQEVRLLASFSRWAAR